jgi:hypothetical protein
MTAKYLKGSPVLRVDHNRQRATSCARETNHRKSVSQLNIHKSIILQTWRQLLDDCKRNSMLKLKRSSCSTMKMQERDRGNSYEPLNQEGHDGRVYIYW